MILDLNNVASNLNTLKDKYNLNIVDGLKICLDEDLECLLSDSGIDLDHILYLEHEFSFDDDYKPVGCDYGDLLYTYVLTQNNSKYKCNVYAVFNGMGVDEGFDFGNIEPLSDVEEFLVEYLVDKEDILNILNCRDNSPESCLKDFIKEKVLISNKDVLDINWDIDWYNSLAEFGKENWNDLAEGDEDNPLDQEEFGNFLLSCWDDGVALVFHNGKVFTVNA